MRIRSVIKWFLVMLVTVAVGASGAFWWFWNRTDQMLYERLVTQFSEQAPGWTIILGDAHFDWQNQSRVYLSHLSFQPPGQTAPLMEVPSAIVYLDGDLLRDNMQVVLRKIVIQDCHLNAKRHPDGSWNLDALKSLQQKTKQDFGFPEIHLNRASVNLKLEQAESQLSTQFPIENANLRCIPGGKELYQILGTADIPELGHLQVRGDWDIAHGKWEINGHMNGLPADQKLLEMLTRVEPETREKLARVDHRLHDLCSTRMPAEKMSFDDALSGTSPDEGEVISSAGQLGDSSLPPLITVSHIESQQQSAQAIPNFGLSGEMQVNFRLAKPDRDSSLDYRFLLELSQGQLDNPLLPFPLRQVQGVVYLDRKQVLIRDVTAVNGKMKINLSADLEIHGLSTPGQLKVAIQQMPLSDRLKRMLKPDVQKIYESLNPSGLLDVSGTFYYDGFGQWDQEDVSYEIYQGTAAYEKFPYPLHDISGTIIPRELDNGGSVFEYKFRGKAGQRTVRFFGSTRPKDEGGAAKFRLQCESLPIDETFLSASPPAVRHALENLDLRGKCDLDVDLNREAGVDRKMNHRLNLDVYEGTLEYNKFPYPVKQVSGTVSFDSREHVWHISDVQGKHGDASVTAAGTVFPKQGNSRMELTLRLNDAPIDHQLEHAVSGILPSLWEELSPSGRVSALTTITWMPDRDVLDVRLPKISVTDGSLLLKSFRYAFDDVKAEMSYANGHVEISSLAARHEDTKLRGRADYQLEPDGLWTLTFRDLVVEDLLPDRQFRNALPDSMAEGLDSLAPEGHVTLEASLFELRGAFDRPNVPITAAWDLTGYVAGVDMFAGVQVDNAHGKFQARGIWDGKKSRSKGTVNLDSAFVLNQQLTQIQGPFVVNDREISIGAVQTNQQGSPPAHMTAELLRGKLSVDARAVIGSEKRDVYGQLDGVPTEYKAIIRVNGARLEDYLQQQGGGAARMQGIVNGQVTLRGKGQDPKDLQGEGMVVIKPAALYELPVILQIFQRLNIAAPPDNAAFDEALLKFDIRNEQFVFSQIDLLGNTLSLRGRGTVRFDEKLDLVFFSIVPKSQPVIPLVREIVRSASYGWVAVDVKGSISQPRTQVKTNLVVDNALRNFLYSFQPFRPAIEGALNETDPKSSQKPLPERR